MNDDASMFRMRWADSAQANHAAPDFEPLTQHAPPSDLPAASPESVTLPEAVENESEAEAETDFLAEPPAPIATNQFIWPARPATTLPFSLPQPHHLPAPPPQTGGHAPTAALLALSTALIGAMAGFALVPVGAVTQAVLVGATQSDDLARVERASLESAQTAAAIVTHLGASTLLRCDVFDTPLSLLPSSCLGPLGGNARERASAIVHDALTVEPDAAGRNLTLAIHHADAGLAAEMLAVAVGQERQDRAALRANLSPAPDASALQDVHAQLETTERDISALLAAAATHDPVRELQAASDEEAGQAARQADIQLRLSAVEAELASSRDMMKSTPQLVVGSEQTSRRDAADGARQALLQMRLERAHLESAYAPGYAGLADINRKIALAEQSLRTPAQAVEATDTRRRNPAYDALAVSVASLTPQAEGLAAQLRVVGKARAEAARRRAELSSLVTRLDSLRQRQARLADTARSLTAQAGQVPRRNGVSAAEIDGLEWHAQSTKTYFGGAMRLAMTALGGFGGLCLGFVLPRRLRDRRAVRQQAYRNPTEAARHLDLPHLASIDFNNGLELATLPRHATQHLFRALHLRDRRPHMVPAVIHVMGIDQQDGAVDTARTLAQSITGTFGLGVAVSKIGGDGEEWVEHFNTAPASDPALSADEDAAIPPNEHARLPVRQFGHDVTIVVSLHNSAAECDVELAARCDLVLLVLRAGHSQRNAAWLLCQSLQQRGARPAGFIFTECATA